MNNLTIVGRIGSIRDLKYTQSGKAVTSFSVAVDNGKTSDGEKREATWFEVTLWEKQAEALAEYLAVGDRVGVSGQARLKVDEGKDGQKYPKLVVDFPRVELLGEKKQAQPTQQRPAQRQAAPTQRQAAPANHGTGPAPEVDDSSDIPF